MREVLVAALVLMAGVAGCLGADTDGGTEDESGEGTPVDETWAERAVPHSEEHDHSAREDHRNLSTPNFEVLGHDPLITDYHGETSGGYLCGEDRKSVV